MKKKVNIPLFISDAGCPHRCRFCSQEKITGQRFEFNENDMRESILQALSSLVYPQEAEIAFFGGSFTGLPLWQQRKLLTLATEIMKEYPVVTGIRFSTRPDYFSEEIFKLLSEFPVRSIELGIQSFDNKVLLLNQRGYEADSIPSVVEQLKTLGYQVGLQLMPGLLGSTIASDLDSIESAIKLKPHFMRFYPTLVIAGTMLEKDYHQGIFKPLSLENAIKLSGYFYQRCFQEGISIIRMGIHGSDEIRDSGAIIAGPFHPAFTELVRGELYYSFFKEKIKRGSIIECDERTVGYIVGHKKRNLSRVGLLKVEINSLLERGSIIIDQQHYSVSEIMNQCLFLQEIKNMI